MFLDTTGHWPPPEPWQPRPSVPRLSKRDEHRLVVLVGINLALWFVAPLAGVTMWDVAVALLTH